jgi:hypothetical protein
MIVDEILVESNTETLLLMFLFVLPRTSSISAHQNTHRARFKFFGMFRVFTFERSRRA